MWEASCILYSANGVPDAFKQGQTPIQIEALISVSLSFCKRPSTPIVGVPILAPDP